MDFIRPVSDLRNNFADISKTVHETAQPVFLTKNGYGDMVVMSMEAFEKLQFESEVYFKLKEAEREALLSSLTAVQRRRFEKVMEGMSIAAITREEHGSYNSIKESVEKARQKLKKYL